MEKLKHLVETQQLSSEVIFELFHEADELQKSDKKPLKGKILATIFYEPSTRTRLSFESAMMRLGGRVLTTENAKEFSSAVKGESIEDTTRTVASYADAIVMRHFEEGAAARAAAISPVPIINAGDGGGQHPTQALLDLYTIYKECKKVDGLKIAMIGDLTYGRTVRSLCYLLGKFNDIQIIFVSPENLKMREDIKEYLKTHAIRFEEETDLNKVLPEVDIVYMTRIQKERMLPKEYENAKGKYVITKENLSLIKPDSRVLHPLPHVEEVDLPVELEQSDPRIAYFRQVRNGLYVRMALLNHLLAA
ncbi:MAG: aspartate carbamoyltransferase [Nanoarchaeota archaeon]|nr:aspartate carbamoyltransferase [Nanoarchaeota archaeon]MBU0977874.1 aspartate carbamoyltransferase [Nanoarchaeota archaeon]